MPFSDPMADGPVIQRASERALAQGVGLERCAGNGCRIPPARCDHAGGADGLRQPDRSDGCDELRRPRASCGRRWRDRRRLSARGGGRVRSAARGARHSPRYSCSRRPRRRRASPAVGALARGYVYYVSLKGVTGAGHLDTAESSRSSPKFASISRCRSASGFGIRDAAGAQAIAAHADAVVIGSRIIQEIESGPADQAAARAGAWLATIRSAIERSRGRRCGRP